MARGLPLTDTSPPDGRLGPVLACTIDASPGIVANSRYFGLLTALAAVLLCLAAAVPAAAAPHVPDQLLVKYRATATARGARRGPRGGRSRLRRRRRRPHRAGRRSQGGSVREAAAAARARPTAWSTRCPTTSPRRPPSRPTTPGKAGPGGWAVAAVELHRPVRRQHRGRLGQRDRRGQCRRRRHHGRGARHRRRVPDLAGPPLPASRPTSTAPASCAASTSCATTSSPTTATATAPSWPALIAQATNNGIGVTGVAYHSRIMPVRVLDYEGKGDVATIARGIRLAARRGAQRDQHELRVRHRAAARRRFPT